MNKPFIADEKTYITDDMKHTRTVYHPAILFKSDKTYCYFPDENTPSGLIEYDNEKDALVNAEILYRHYVLDKE